MSARNTAELIVPANLAYGLESKLIMQKGVKEVIGSISRNSVE